MPQSPDVGQNSDGGISDFRISGQSIINENCHNYRTIHDIDMKLNLARETRQLHKSLTLALCQQILSSMSFFQLMVNSQSPGSRIPDAQPIKLRFSLTITFCLKKTQNRTRKSLIHIGTFLPKKANFLLKNADISKIPRVLVLKGIFSKTKYV